MTNGPLVSVIMNCFDGERYLAQAIDSVRAQTYQNWEIVFWDNQSTDRSAEIFQTYRDPRFKYFHAPTHTTLSEARNYALAEAQGELVAFLDVDDWWVTDKLAMQVPRFADPEVGVVCGNYYLISEKRQKQWVAFTRPMPSGWILDHLLRFYFPGLLTLMIRRSAVQSLKYPCDPSYHIIGDLDLVVRLSVNWKVDYLAHPLGYCRKHGGNETIRHLTRYASELEHWLTRMSQVDEVRSSAGWESARNHSRYTRGLEQALSGHRTVAFRVFREISWSWLKLRLLVVLLSPRLVIHRVKN